MSWDTSSQIILQSPLQMMAEENHGGLRSMIRGRKVEMEFKNKKRKPEVQKNNHLVHTTSTEESSNKNRYPAKPQSKKWHI